MAIRAKRLCGHPGCNTLVDAGRCDKHKQQQSNQYDEHRGNFRDRGYTSTWDKVRAMKVKKDPLCEECLKQGNVTPVEIVHHIIPVDLCRQIGRDDFIYDMDNLKSDCWPCHGKEREIDLLWYKFAGVDWMKGTAKELIARFERWRTPMG